MIGSVAAAYRAAFSGLPRPVWILAGATLVNRAGTMVLPFMSLYLTRQLGFTTLEAGQVLSMYGFGAVAGSYLGGWLSDRVGAVSVQIWSLLGTGAGFLILGQLRGRPAVMVAVLAVSVVAEAFRPALMTSVTLAAAPVVRTRSFSLVRLAVNLGMSLGPAVGGFLAVHHYRLLFAVDAATCWLAALLLFAVLPRATRPAPARAAAERAAVSPWRDPPFVAFLVLVFVLACGFFQILSTLPLTFREAYGFEESTIGVLLALNALGVALFEMVLMHAIEHLHPLRIAAVGSLLVCGGMALTAAGTGLGFAVLTVLVWTAGEMLSLPLLNTVAARRSAPESAGAYLGAYSLSFSLAFVVAPLVGTAVYQRFGPRPLWLGIGVLGVVLWGAFRRLALRLGEEGLEPGGRDG